MDNLFEIRVICKFMMFNFPEMCMIAVQGNMKESCDNILGHQGVGGGYSLPG